MTPSRWSSLTNRRPAGAPAVAIMRGRGASSALPALLAFLALAAPAWAATILRQTVEVDIRGDGGVREHRHLEVRIDAQGDSRSWSTIPIYFDEKRATLGAVSAWVRKPDGATEKLWRRDFDSADAIGEGVLKSSGKLRVVRFPPAPAGSVLGLEYDFLDRPYFPAGAVELYAGEGGDAIEYLSVEVRGGGAGWRWHIAGPAGGLRVSESPGAVKVTASGLPRLARVDLAPGRSRLPVLLYGWSGPATWGAVADWFAGIAREVPRDREAVRRTARQLTAGVEGKRERLEVLLRFVRRQVRYVAVEVGIGGYRPAPAEETLARRWGDCKAKVFLLLDLLKEAGIEAYPVLVPAAEDDRIDPEFPSHLGFNHLIAALPAADLTPSPDDPVAGGLLFVDPTQTRGGARWLEPWVQGQQALVVRGEASKLMRLPLRPQLETSRLSLQLAARDDGGIGGIGGVDRIEGSVRWELHGGKAAEYTERFAGEPPERIAEQARTLLAAALPGANLSSIEAAAIDSAVPGFVFSARISAAGLVAAGEAGARSFTVPGLIGTPAPAVLRDRTLPLFLTLGVTEVSWRMSLPRGWCPAQRDEGGADNEIASFRQAVACEGEVFTLERRTELRQRWVEPAQLPRLAEVALAEHRAAARRIHLDRLRAQPASPHG